MKKLLKECYKTRAGAEKRCRFENAVAKGEFERGDKARHYRYSIVTDREGLWRVQRDVLNVPNQKKREQARGQGEPHVDQEGRGP